MKKQKQPQKSTKQGFTLIETSLSTALIAILLLAVAMIIMNIVSIYRKGMTLKTMNSVGRTLVEDFNTTIAASIPTEILSSEEATGTTANAKVFSESYYRNYTAENENDTSKGAFCTGSYSYLWQTYSDRDGSSIVLTYYTDQSGVQETEEISDFRLLKIQDPEQYVCEKMTDESIDKIKLIPSDSDDETENDGYATSISVEEMLANTDIVLVVYNLTVSPVDSSVNLNQDLDTLSTEVFFSGVITLGTTTEIENVEAGSSNSLRLDTEACNTENINMDGTVSEFDYCAVNKFKFAARAGSSDV